MCGQREWRKSASLPHQHPLPTYFTRTVENLYTFSQAKNCTRMRDVINVFTRDNLAGLCGLPQWELRGFFIDLKKYTHDPRRLASRIGEIFGARRSRNFQSCNIFCNCASINSWESAVKTFCDKIKYFCFNRFYELIYVVAFLVQIPNWSYNVFYIIVTFRHSRLVLLWNERFLLILLFL